jgi:hypothetical protein
VTLPLFDNSNYKLTSESSELTGKSVDRADDKVVSSWQMRVPKAGEDGMPFKIVLAGPNFEHRGSAFRLHLVTKDDEDLSGDANISIETVLETGNDEKIIFDGKYAEFSAISNQNDPNESLSLKSRSEVGKDHIIKLKVSVDEGTPEPDLSAEGSYFEVEVYKIWMNMSA